MDVGIIAVKAIIFIDKKINELAIVFGVRNQ